MKRSFKYYCKDYTNIENYEKAKADNFKCWDCHHRLETHNSDGERRLVDITASELQALGMYYNRPSSELIFMKRNEHRSLHKHSEETRKEMSESKKNMSAETKKKMREAHKGKKHSAETKKKIAEAKKGNTNTKGRHWYNNGEINIRAKECPDGFVLGRLLIYKETEK